MLLISFPSAGVNADGKMSRWIICFTALKYLIKSMKKNNQFLWPHTTVHSRLHTLEGILLHVLDHLEGRADIVHPHIGPSIYLNTQQRVWLRHQCFCSRTLQSAPRAADHMTDLLATDWANSIYHKFCSNVAKNPNKLFLKSGNFDRNTTFYSYDKVILQMNYCQVPLFYTACQVCKRTKKRYLKNKTNVCLFWGKRNRFD